MIYMHALTEFDPCACHKIYRRSFGITLFGISSTIAKESKYVSSVQMGLETYISLKDECFK